MKLSNLQIYEIALDLQKYNEKNYTLPVVVNFFIQKNIQNIMTAAESIEKSRTFILEKYGKYNEEKDSYMIDPDKVKLAQKELDSLMELEQEIPVQMIQLSEIAGVELDSLSLKAILFMIQDTNKN